MTAKQKSLAVLLLAAICVVALAQTSTNVDIAVVVHPDTPITNLSMAEVRKVFLGDRQYWSTNVPVVLLTSMKRRSKTDAPAASLVVMFSQNDRFVQPLVGTVTVWNRVPVELFTPLRIM